MIQKTSLNIKNIIYASAQYLLVVPRSLYNLLVNLFCKITNGISLISSSIRRLISSESRVDLDFCVTFLQVSLWMLNSNNISRDGAAITKCAEAVSSFCTVNGSPLSPSLLYDIFSELCDKDDINRRKEVSELSVALYLRNLLRILKDFSRACKVHGIEKLLSSAEDDEDRSVLTFLNTIAPNGDLNCLNISQAMKDKIESLETKRIYTSADI